MAKVDPIKSNTVVECCDDEERYPTVCFYDTPLTAVKGLSVGDDVIVTLKGKVKSLSQREDYDDKDVVRGSFDVSYNDISVKSGKKTEWDEMVDD